MKHQPLMLLEHSCHPGKRAGRQGLEQGRLQLRHAAPAGGVRRRLFRALAASPLKELGIRLLRQR